MKRPRIALRLFRLMLAVCLLAGGLLGYMRYIEPYWTEVTRLDVKTDKISGSFRAVAFGDVHIGMGKDIEDIKKLVELINRQEPDAVFFLGDLFDNYSLYGGDVEACLEVLAGIEAQYKFAVRGNHDVGGGAQWVYPQIISDCGFTLLENASQMLDVGINIVGSADSLYFTPDVDDYIGQGFDLLLAHEPDIADEISGVELQLSGHSHGGQVYIPFLMDRILPEGARKYFRGRYEKPDGIVYVNRGYGMSLLPLRLFSRPEITVLTIEGE